MSKLHLYSQDDNSLELIIELIIARANPDHVDMHAKLRVKEMKGFKFISHQEQLQ